MKGETGEYSIRQAIKELGWGCQGAYLEKKSGCREELSAAYHDGKGGALEEGQKLWMII